MPHAFNFNVSPFDCLSAEQRRLVRDSVDIEFVPPDQVMLAAGASPEHLVVLIQGHVRQWEGDDLVATYGPDDCFDGRALVTGVASHRFVAASEVLAYRLPRDTVNTLITHNATFAALLFADLSKKLAALSAHHRQHELQSLTLARVDQAVLRPPQYVDAALDIVSVVRLFVGQRVTHVLVRGVGVAAPGAKRADGPADATAGGVADGVVTAPADGPANASAAADGTQHLGIFTTAGLQRAILHGRPLDQLPVGDLASHPLVCVAPDAPLFEALAVMIRHRVQRVVVRAPAGPGQAGRQAPGGPILGVLEQVDLLGFLSNHSTLVTRQILEATELAALAAPAAQITQVIGLLQRGGTKVGLIARLVQELNALLFERAWQLMAPPALVANSCLFVMGSEGRGEQLLKTDQDNGLILRDGYTPPADLAAICQRFSQALADFGYPECPGQIMLSNPEWRHEAADFGERVRRWLLMPSPDSLMSLAIFLDAHAVAGDATLLAQVRGEVFNLVTDNDALLARFAAAINAFEGGGGWWSRLFSLEDGPGLLDLKKAGSFPLVHGVRSLALAHRVQATGTVARLEALVAAGALEQGLATDLVDSLHFFMGLKLKLGLAALEAGQAPGGGIEVDRLSSLDRDLLKDTLAVVKRFKQLLRLRFHLDAL
ncbi:putative nucleotidyltransferase substrate binding domain-containing protein [Aquabacterium sp. OR-4]|uniref:putative nucleotidyltransferase substrate binding domain-containing protein n=1 Tax=Aquabacterium sp. OR-4 TaxID=2978127 RepID=UPI0021B2A3EA|nr:putative nucleotidyltransferase substrate binding domain-containing protein [Aquabacterium sp. OR-4]MDT7836177.1 putative nucleotidyltransferase substrate binding domain-containing protein [Aquabacterium sp. OR-4]